MELTELRVLLRMIIFPNAKAALSLLPRLKNSLRFVLTVRLGRGADGAAFSTHDHLS